MCLELCFIGIITAMAKRCHLKCQILAIGSDCLSSGHRTILRLREKEYLHQFAMFSVVQKEKTDDLID